MRTSLVFALPLVLSCAVERRAERAEVRSAPSPPAKEAGVPSTLRGPVPQVEAPVPPMTARTLRFVERREGSERVARVGNLQFRAVSLDGYDGAPTSCRIESAKVRDERSDPYRLLVVDIPKYSCRGLAADDKRVYVLGFDNHVAAYSHVGVRTWKSEVRYPREPLLSDADALFFLSSDDVIRVDKTTGKATTLSRSRHSPTLFERDGDDLILVRSIEVGRDGLNTSDTTKWTSQLEIVGTGGATPTRVLVTTEPGSVRISEVRTSDVHVYAKIGDSWRTILRKGP